MCGKRSILLSVAINSLLCSITLFVSSGRFVNPEVTPKWMALMMVAGFLGIIFSVTRWSLPHNTRWPAFVMPTPHYLYATIIAFAFAPVKDNRTSEEQKIENRRQGETPEAEAQGVTLPP